MGRTHEPAARRSSGRSVSSISGEDHQPSPSAGASGGGDRLGLPGGTLQFGLSPRAGAATVADTIGSRTVHSQHMHNLSDEALCDSGSRTRIFSISAARWCSGTDLPFDRSSLTRWRQRLARGFSPTANLAVKGITKPPNPESQNARKPRPAHGFLAKSNTCSRQISATDQSLPNSSRATNSSGKLGARPFASVRATAT